MFPAIPAQLTLASLLASHREGKGPLRALTEADPPARRTWNQPVELRSHSEGPPEPAQGWRTVIPARFEAVTKDEPPQRPKERKLVCRTTGAKVQRLPLGAGFIVTKQVRTESEVPRRAAQHVPPP